MISLAFKKEGMPLSPHADYAVNVLDPSRKICTVFIIVSYLYLLLIRTAPNNYHKQCVNKQSLTLNPTLLIHSFLYFNNQD